MQSTQEFSQGRVPAIFRQDYRCGEPVLNIELWALARARGTQAADACQDALCNERGWGLDDPSRRIQNHDHFEGRPDIKVSRSHTRTVGAIAVAQAPPDFGIGLDIEVEGRPLRPGIERHFLNEQDEIYAAEKLLPAWVAKEAVFKALAPHRSHWQKRFDMLLLSRTWIDAGRFGLVGSPRPLGHYCLEPIVVDGQRLLMGLAVLGGQH